MLDALAIVKAGDGDPLASCRFPGVLALEIKTAGGRPKTPLDVILFAR
jgi:hypothetical protein